MIQKSGSNKRLAKPAVEYIADAIKAARSERLISQRALSNKVGIPQGHLSRIENGEVDPRLSSVIEIARALDYEIAFVPRAVLPTIKSLERRTSQTDEQSNLEVRTTIRNLAKIQQDAQKLAKKLPESKEFQKLATTISEIRNYSLDPRFANRIREIVEQARPALGALLSAQQHIKNWSENPNTKMQLQQIVKAAAAFQQTRNALAHGAIEPAQDPVPAYQLTPGES